MSGRIFINYRRGDDPGYTGRLFDYLESNFSADQLFIDVDNIAAGEDFVQALERQVAQCTVMLSVIGRQWIGASDSKGRRRLDDSRDFVRIEIESALRLGKRVIPVLVNGADMPSEEELPPSLAPLARRNAVRLTHERFRADAKGLVAALKQGVAEARPAERPAENERAAARAADEIAQQKRDAEAQQRVAEQQRQAMAEEQRRAAAEAATRAEQLAKEAAERAQAAKRRLAEAEAAAKSKATEADNVVPRPSEVRAQPRDGLVPGAAGAEQPIRDLGDTPVRSQEGIPQPQGGTVAGQDLAAADTEDVGLLQRVTSKEALSGGLFLLLGAIGFVAGPGWPAGATTPDSAVMSSSAWPYTVAILLIATGALKLLVSFFVEVDPVDNFKIRPLVLVLAACALFAALLPLAGVVIAMAALGVVSLAATRVEWRAMATFAVLASIGVAILVWGLKLPIPLVGVWLKT